MSTSQTNQTHKASNPFSDFTTESMKMFKDFQMPKVNFEEMIRAHRKNLETFTKAQKAAFETAKNMAQTHAEYARDAFKDMQAHFEEVVNAKTLEEKVQSHGKNLKNSFEKAMNHGKGLTEMLTKTHEEITGAWHKRFNEGVEEARKMATQNSSSARH